MTLLRRKAAILLSDDIALRDVHPDLQLRISPRAKRIALRLDTASRKVNLVVPKRFSMTKALDFAAQHRHWITEQISALPQNIPFDNGSIIPILGRNRTLTIRLNRDLKKTSIILNSNNISILSNLDDIAPRLKRFLKNEAKDTMANLAHEKAATIGKAIAAIQIRDTKTRWGSCSPDGKIMLSWRLIFAPWEAMDYVVAHEVAHLVHMNHGAEFWALCEELSEDYVTGKSWMRENGHELMRYG